MRGSASHKSLSIGRRHVKTCCENGSTMTKCLRTTRVAAQMANGEEGRGEKGKEEMPKCKSDQHERWIWTLKLAVSTPDSSAIGQSPIFSKP